MREFLKWVKSSFDTYSKGASARKLTAFSITACVILIHIMWIRYAYRHEDFQLLPEILIIDYSFIAALLGMTTYQYIKTKDNGKQDNSGGTD